MAKAKVMVFTRFERFSHWAQAILIVLLMITGFEVNGAYTLLGYEEAAGHHRDLAWFLIGLWIFIIFWHFITGEWRQYIPTTDKLISVARYYSVGIFQAEVPHPYKKTRLAKHNPLQRLAYLSFNLMIAPVIWISGLLYMFYNDWAAIGIGDWSLAWVALIHAAAAFAMLAFFIGHVYMGFTGSPLMSHVKAMITGYDEHVEDDTPA
jgi:thiosulfate reductase cytochrome b subunit